LFIRESARENAIAFKTVQVKTDTRAFGGIKNVQKREVIFFTQFLRPDHCWNHFACVSSGMQL
jgi:hypothetical protein